MFDFQKCNGVGASLFCHPALSIGGRYGFVVENEFMLPFERSAKIPSQVQHETRFDYGAKGLYIVVAR